MLHIHVVQFHFGVKGQGQFSYNDGSYHHLCWKTIRCCCTIPTKICLLRCKLNPKSWGFPVDLDSSLYELFSSEANHIPFLSKENKQRRYYKDETILLDGYCAQPNASGQFPPWYNHFILRQKTFELLSLYFTPQQRDVENALSGR